jgi:hypothetical protein
MTTCSHKLAYIQKRQRDDSQKLAYIKKIYSAPASITKILPAIQRTYILNLTHVEPTACVRPFKRNAFARLQPMHAAHLGTTSSDSAKCGVLTRIWSIVRLHNVLIVQKLQRKLHKSTGNQNSQIRARNPNPRKFGSLPLEWKGWSTSRRPTKA